MTETETPPPENKAPKQDIPNMERRDTGQPGQYKRSIYALPVSVDVVIGRAKPTISELLSLEKDSLLTLDKTIEDLVDLCIDNRVIARGELIETDPATGAIGVKITEITDIAEDQLL